jgi:enoyl-CoA hydratase
VDSFETLDYEVSDRILTMWLNRQPGNAMTQQMFRDIAAAFGLVDRLDGDIRAVIVAARGENFSVGADLHDLADSSPADSYYTLQTARKAWWAAYDCLLPVVAAVNGAAVGGGLALASVCDLIVAAKGARLGMPEIKVGVSGGAAFVRRIAPQPLARWMFLTGEPVTAEQLHSYGTVLDVVGEDQLMTRARQAASMLTRHSPRALRMAKEALNRVEYQSLKEGYEFEQGFTAMLTSHPDSKEAATAFREKREGNFEPFQMW